MQRTKQQPANVRRAVEVFAKWIFPPYVNGAQWSFFLVFLFGTRLYLFGSAALRPIKKTRKKGKKKSHYLILRRYAAEPQQGRLKRRFFCWLICVHAGRPNFIYLAPLRSAPPAAIKKAAGAVGRTSVGKIPF
ncbi:MAG TPA: hypothetical protein VK892_20225 [Pyrinomonadaceae bacterium]|nr:hypothetical protein [Pyrinomonadaceae bacterium]